MTEQDMSHIPVVVPEGKDNIHDLTMGELDIASRHLQTDVFEAVNGEKRYAAFIELAVLWAKRSGDKTKSAELVERFRGYTTRELFHALRMDVKPAAVEPDPTTSSDESSESS